MLAAYSCKAKATVWCRFFYHFLLLLMFLWQHTHKYGFTKGRGVRDATAALWVLYERNLVYNSKVFVCYVDYIKPFYRVGLNWVKMLFCGR